MICVFAYLLRTIKYACSKMISDWQAAMEKETFSRQCN